MKAILICGSPRQEGNTEILLGQCRDRLEKAEIQTQTVLLRGKTIKPCIACAYCIKHGSCAIQNDDFQPVYEAMLQADIIVVGSPVYFGSATPELMALLDRAGFVARFNKNPFSRKIGGPLVVARRAGQNFTYAQLLLWYMINDMIVPGSSYWNVAFGLGPGDVMTDKEGLDTIGDFADNLVWLAQKLVAE